MKGDSTQYGQEVIPVKRSRTYRTVKVNGVDWGRVLSGREGTAAWVGMDVSKDELVVSCRWGDGRFDGPRKSKSRGAFFDISPGLMF